jgi:hypothetical protein
MMITSLDGIEIAAPIESERHDKNQPTTGRNGSPNRPLHPISSEMTLDRKHSVVPGAMFRKGAIVIQ